MRGDDPELDLVARRVVDPSHQQTVQQLVPPRMFHNAIRVPLLHALRVLEGEGFDRGEFILSSARRQTSYVDTSELMTVHLRIDD